MGRIRAGAVLVTAAMTAVAGLTGCSSAPASSTTAVIGAAAPVALMDQPAHLTITGLAPDDTVTVTAQARDAHSLPWQAHADFRADAHGTVDLDSAAPLPGSSYQGADGMGLFWSMNTPSVPADQAEFDPPQNAGHSFAVTVAVTAHGRALASRTLTRESRLPGVTSTALTLASDKVVGELFLPPKGTPRHPAVLAFGGSEGGNGQIPVAALLASHGYPALALAYFGAPGLPAHLNDIPLEYFATAARLLAAQPAADPAHVVVMSVSRGTEAALLLADDYPQLIHGVVVDAPGAQVDPGFPDGGNAWTVGGRPVPQTAIPLNHIDGPLLAVAGADDQVWDSPDAVQLISYELSDAGDRYPHQALVYPDAGHWAGSLPYLPLGTETVEDGSTEDLGGTRAGVAASREASWPKVLALLAGLENRPRPGASAGS
jgi:dienelactone hydrolase